MSLILEALKKSERQRRLGESPSIGSPVIAVRRRRNLLPILIALIVIGLLALWWMRRDSGEPTSAVPTTTAPAIISNNAPAAPAEAPVGPTFDDAPLPVVANQPDPDVRTLRDTRTASADAERRQKFRDGELVAANPEAGAAATIKESEPVSAADPVALAAAMGETTTPVTRADTPVVRSRDGKAPNAGAAAPTTPVNHLPDTLPLMWELPLATRQKLPDIKISMHVFATEPAQRFVIINGDRRAQGDDFDGMKLVEIRADGVVFEYEGTRFLYPRSGR